MPFLIAGLLLLWFASIGLKTFVRMNPATLARAMRRIGGIAALLLALFLMVRGRFDIAIGLGGLGYWLIKGRRFSIFDGLRGFVGSQSGARRVSRVRSPMIEMELDHATGAMTGSVLAGPDEGTSLEQLSWPRCLALFRRCTRDDLEGARLLEAYFDRRFAGWRQAAHEGGDARSGGPGGENRRMAGAMSEDEAHEVLGLGKRASREEITRAHRALMKKLHPDHGGSTNLAARVNEAKDVLLRRHP